MRISVAMCTYNGQRTLPEQLQSIVEQTRPPDELIVCDDASSDGTAKLLADFASRGGFCVRVTVNPCNVGSTANFGLAISQCSGDLILLSDQDDVWLPQKLAVVEQCLENNPAAGFAFSDALMVDETRAPLGYTLWEALLFGAREQEQVRRGGAFDYLLRRYVATGATLAFRARYRELVLPIPDCWVHDNWIGLMISAFASPVFISEPLIEYRQHSRQQIGEKKRGLYGQYLLARRMGLPQFRRDYEMFSAAYERLSGLGQGVVDPVRLAAARQKADHCRLRLAMREGGRLRRIPRIVAELGRYGRYSLGWKSIAQDLLL